MPDVPLTDRFIDPSSLFSPLIEHAIELSAQWHDQTYRKSQWREPAFEPPTAEQLRVPVAAHVTAVAVTVLRAGWDDVTVAAAFLHDTIEDANRFGQEFRYEELGTFLGEDVAARVLEVTEQKYDMEGNLRRWRVRKEDYVRRLRTASPGAMAISIADKLHNLWSINESLGRGLDVFASADGRRGLSAGPEEQRWFHRAVLEAATWHDDPRLVPMRARLEQEIRRFERLTDQEEAG